MNERIRKLFELHTVPAFTVGDNVDLSRNSKGEYVNSTLEDHWQTFQEAAELIVEDCVHVIQAAKPGVQELPAEVALDIVAKNVQWYYGIGKSKGWVCSKCGTDRTQAACPQGHMAVVEGKCPMSLEAQ